ncbi:E3 SUMO-protein ligase ZBED1-like [Vanessa cardui]|uniref:E3 SUMO-protein ligase ZBED1-like n=1 Tax=Vanessa cardui TaxID=171605 RepID=UPI001F143E56|nr:E3 SUMO-protein ligase ZBED1-like [Vanessa cardui]
MAPGTKKSVVWEFFNKNTDSAQVSCKLCSAKYKYVGGTTTSLVNHLKKKHIVQYAEAVGSNLQVEEIENRNTSSQNSNVVILNEPAPKRQKQMRLTAPTKINQRTGDEALLNMIVLDMQPLQIVENEGFRKFVKTLNRDYELPSRKKVTQSLEEKYKICSSEAKEKLKEVADIAITTDIWSSDSQKSFISVTTHFIRQGTLNSVVISTSELLENHTSLNIANSLKAILMEWQIFDKVVTIVTDNASSMKKAVKDYLNKRNHFCVAHTLNLAVKDCLIKDSENAQTNYLKNSEVLDIISKCRAIVTHFKQSVKSSNTLRDMQRQMNMDIIKLKQEVNTRWNSTFYMFERLLRTKVALSATLPLLDSPPANLNASEWAILEDCVALLQPIEKMSTTLSGDSYPTLSCIIPLVRGLQHSVSKKVPSTSAGQHLQQSLLDVIDKRLSVYENNRTAAKATILDPRFKKKAFGLETSAENAVKYVLEELAQYQLPASTARPLEPAPAAPSTSQAGDDELWEILDKRISESNTQQTPLSSASIVLKQYLEIPYLDRKQNPLDFWEQRKHVLPSLYIMAHRYLCIPATSVPSERLFSKAGILTNQRRNRLLPKKVDQILFLNSYCTEKQQF